MSTSSIAARKATVPFRLGKDDPTFAWVTDHEPAMEPWRMALAEWVRGAVYPAPAMQHGRELVRYLWSCPTAARDPERFCRADYSAPMELASFFDRPNSRSNTAAKLHNGIYRFFDWLLHDRPSGPLADGSRAYRNPLSRKPLVAGPARTHRTAMPIALLDALAEVLTADDYAWPKTIAADWGTDVHGNRVWCPVRAVAMLIKVRLPLRNADVRFLESGEGDAERFTPAGWVANPTPCCTGGRGKAPRRGFLRRLRRTEGTDMTVFFVNTDKGYDRMQFAHHPGRVVPWPQDDVAQAVYGLEAWQQEHNPVAAPTRWTALQDGRVRKDPKAYEKQPDAFFLLRDPLGTLRNEPLSDARLRTMWLALLDETSQRLTRGDYPELAAAIPQLVDARSPSGRATHAVYDLHTPRVSYTTALYEVHVPPATIGSCLGHTTERMTSHYYAPSDAAVVGTMKEAQQRLRENRSANLAACEKPGGGSLWLPASGVVGLMGAAASGGSPSGLASPVSSTTGYGVCPVGAGRCHVGGPVTADGVPGPVPGGPHRCLQCRFFATGPAHLPGLLDRLNGLCAAFGRRIAAYWRREFDARRCEDSLSAVQDPAARPGLRAQFVAAQKRSDEALGEVVALQPVWEAAFAAATRCQAVARTGRAGLDLVVNGTAEDWAEAQAAAKEPDVLRAVVKDARVHCGPDAASAETARRVADRLVAEHCVEPPPATLAPEHARAVASAQVAWRVRVASGWAVDGASPRRDLWSWAEGGCAT